MKNQPLNSTRGATMDPPLSKDTKALLVSGIGAGPLFIVVALIQAFTRQGFDVVRLPLSLLSVGDLGWIQRTNFVVDGLLAVACAYGIRQRLHSGHGRTWGPLLVGGYGAGLIIAGFFPPDPHLAFPLELPKAYPQRLRAGTLSCTALPLTLHFSRLLWCASYLPAGLLRSDAGGGRSTAR